MVVVQQRWQHTQCVWVCCGEVELEGEGNAG